MAHPILDDRPALARVLAAFGRLEERLVTLHVPEFTTVDITMAQAKLLYVLLAAGEMSLSQTAQRLGLAVSTASGAVDHLVALGLVERSDDPANRRQVRVSVSAAGRQVIEQMRELGTHQLVDLAARLDDDELAVIERATVLLTRAAEAAALSETAPNATTTATTASNPATNLDQGSPT